MDFLWDFWIIQYLKCIHKMLQCKIPGTFSQNWAGNGAELKQNHPGGSLKINPMGLECPRTPSWNICVPMECDTFFILFYNLILDEINESESWGEFMERGMNNAGVSWF